METVEAVVIGSGAVGLAIARALALAGREVVILEAEDAIGTHTSSRNSEVIHAGIYYPRGSLKARSCVSGKELLYEYCAAHGVPHRRCGKLIVATDAQQLVQLQEIQRKAAANGVSDVVRIEAAEARAMPKPLGQCWRSKVRWRVFLFQTVVLNFRCKKPESWQKHSSIARGSGRRALRA